MKNYLGDANNPSVRWMDGSEKISLEGVEHFDGGLCPDPTGATLSLWTCGTEVEDNLGSVSLNTGYAVSRSFNGDPEGRLLDSFELTQFISQQSD